MRKLERPSRRSSASWEDRNQSAAGSLAEGLDETLTLHRLGVYGVLGRSLKTTNSLESVNAARRGALCEGRSLAELEPTAPLAGDRAPGYRTTFAEGDGLSSPAAASDRVAARPEDRHDDVEDESRVTNQEPWRVSTKNGLDSERTAQKYMQLARELPKLTAKAPRVADLSLREAIHLVSVTGQIAALAPELQDQVFQRVEQGARPTAAIAAVTAQRRRERIGVPPPDLMPPPQTDSEASEGDTDTRRNACGRSSSARTRPARDCPELVEETRARPQFAAALAEADAAEREAAALDEKAKDLREDAKLLRAEVGYDVRETIVKEHGPIHPFSETLDYKIADEALDEQLKTLRVSELIDYLLAHRGEPSVQEVHRGYYGDMQFMDWVDIAPPLDGGVVHGTAARVSR